MLHSWDHRGPSALTPTTSCLGSCILVNLVAPLPSVSLWSLSSPTAAAALPCVQRHSSLPHSDRQHTPALQRSLLKTNNPYRLYIKPWLGCVRWSHGVGTSVFVWTCICVSGGLAVSKWSCHGLMYLSDMSICRKEKNSPIKGWQSRAVMTSAGVTDKLFNNWVQSKDQFILLVNGRIDLYRHNLYKLSQNTFAEKQENILDITLCSHIYGRRWTNYSLFSNP